MARVIGFDIGSFSIKAVHLTKKGNGFRLESIGIVLNPIGVLPGDDEASQQKVAEASKKLLSDIKLTGSRAILALAESQVYTRVVDMPVLSDAELASAIHFEAEQYIPVPIDQVNIDYEVISRPQKGSGQEKMQIFLVAAPKKVIERATTIANLSGIEVIGLETEMLAVARAMIPANQNVETTMLVHFGASATNISVISNGMPVLSHAIENGGSALTRTLSTELGLEFPQAEEYKRSYGLDTNQLEGKVASSLQPIVDRLLSEVQKAYQYYSNSNQQNPAKRIILTGGGALLPGIVPYMAQLLGIEVILGNSFSQIEPSKTASIPNDTVSFATAVGLAMREV